MSLPPDPDWYLEHVLASASPTDALAASGAGLPVASWHRWWAGVCPDRSPLIDLARRQGWVVTRRQLVEHGAADHDLRRWVRHRAWSVPRFGVASPVVPGADSRRRHALESTGAALVRPGHVISARSAAILHGLPTVDVPAAPETTRRLGTTGHRSGTHVFGATLTAPDLCTWFGAPVTTVARTLVDLGRHDAWDAIMAADAARRENLVIARQVRCALDRAAGWPGIRQARDVLACACPLAESPLESLTRWRLRLSGFPAPVPQFRIGGHVVDLCWPRYRLVLECDGRVKYATHSDWNDPMWREKRREAALRKDRYGIDRVIWSDVTRDWDQTCDRLASHFPAEIVRLIVPR